MSKIFKGLFKRKNQKVEVDKTGAAPRITITDAWRITRPSILIPHQIEGFASATSVNIGETITFFVNCMAPSFSIDIFRMGLLKHPSHTLL